MHSAIWLIAYLIIKLFSFSCSFIERLSELTWNFVSNYFLSTKSPPLIIKIFECLEHFFWVLKTRQAWPLQAHFRLDPLCVWLELVPGAPVRSWPGWAVGELSGPLDCYHLFLWLDRLLARASSSPVVFSSRSQWLLLWPLVVASGPWPHCMGSWLA